jgi:hypothetical protein
MILMNNQLVFFTNVFFTNVFFTNVFFINVFFCLFASSFQLIMHRKRYFYSYSKLIPLIFWVLLPMVLLADPPPPPDFPPPPPGLPIDEFLWVLGVIGLLIGLFYLKSKPSKA